VGKLYDLQGALAFLAAGPDLDQMDGLFEQTNINEM